MPELRLRLDRIVEPRLVVPQQIVASHNEWTCARPMPSRCNWIKNTAYPVSCLLTMANRSSRPCGRRSRSMPSIATTGEEHRPEHSNPTQLHHFSRIRLVSPSDQPGAPACSRSSTTRKVRSQRSDSLVRVALDKGF